MVLKKKQRVVLKKKQKERWNVESIKRSKSLPRGLKAIWFRLTGKYKTIRRHNEQETEKSQVRDRHEMQSLIDRQSKERQNLQRQIRYGFKEHNMELFNLRQDINRYVTMGEMVSVQEKSKDLRYEFENSHEPSR